MTDRAFPLLRMTALAALFALSACDWMRGDDKVNAANDVDPEIANALNDQILVDSNLDGQSNRNGARPPVAPSNATYPSADANPGEGAKGPDAAAKLGQGCSDAAKFHYNVAWVKRLSPNFPVYPGGRVTEAAANNQAGCSTRVVTFTTPHDWQRVLDWYHTRAVGAGYSSEHQLRDGDHVLAGANQKDNGAFYLIVTPKPKGSEVALIANNGK